MKAITYTSARNNLASTLKQVCDEHEPVIVTRKKGESVVILSLEDYESITETAYLLRSPKNAERLLKSIDQLEAGNGKERKLAE